MRQGYFLLLILAGVLLWLHCEKNPSGIQEGAVVKDPRQLKWTVDTLRFPGSYSTDLYDIWGSSTKDVYACGLNNTGSDAIWHYDGRYWWITARDLQGAADYFDVFGFSKDDVWFVGTVRYRFPSGERKYLTRCLHYNGKEWEQIGWNKEGRYHCIWGSDPNNLWCAGWDKIYQFINGDWQEVDYERPNHPQINFGRMAGLAADDIYATALKLDLVEPYDSTAYYLFHYDGESWNLQDSALYTPYGDLPHFGSFLANIGGKLYSAYRGAFKYENGTWIKIHSDLLIGRIFGTSENNIFATGAYGTIYHYNGENWAKLRPVNNIDNWFIHSTWSDGREVFFVATDGRNSYIIHGK